MVIIGRKEMKKKLFKEIMEILVFAVFLFLSVIEDKCNVSAGVSASK